VAPTKVSGGPPAAPERAALAVARIGGLGSRDELAAVVAAGCTAGEGLLAGLASVGAIGIRVGPPTRAARGSTSGRVAGTGPLGRPEPR